MPHAPLPLIDMALRRMPPFVGPRLLATGLRLAGARIARTAVFWGMPTLTGEGDIASRLEIGEHSGMNFGCLFELDAAITLEAHVAVGHEVMFLTRAYDPSSGLRRGTPSAPRPIRIGAGSWLGARCVILPGVTIGAGSVVGAKVVVREDLPPNTMLAGARKVSIAKWRA